MHSGGRPKEIDISHRFQLISSGNYINEPHVDTDLLQQFGVLDLQAN